MQIIQDFLSRHGINDHAFVLGVSGGADSLALALMFKDAYPDFHLVALTVDHGLRPTSRQEALYVADIMQKFGIEHHILTWEDNKPTSGIEEKAREARYDLLCSWCLKHHINNLVIAHHLYDQAETFLMRLQRGSGLCGLSAMDESCNRGSVRILRPLLTTAPGELKAYLTARQIQWIEDESNQCTDFLRVKMRKFLPILEQETGISAEKICLAAENLRHSRKFLEDTAEEIIQRKIHYWADVCCSFDYAEFLSWHNELKFFIIGKLVNELGGQNYRPVAESLCHLLEEMKVSTFESATLGGCLIYRNELRLWLIRETRERAELYSMADWDEFTAKNPEVRGIKIPHKLKQILLNKKISQKK